MASGPVSMFHVQGIARSYAQTKIPAFATISTPSPTPRSFAHFVYHRKSPKRILNGGWPYFIWPTQSLKKIRTKPSTA